MANDEFEVESYYLMDVGVKSLAPAEDNRDQVVSGCEMSCGLNLYIWTLI